MPQFNERAPAKINLTLRVLGKRDDGYHEIESLVAFASVGDAVTLDTDQRAGVDVTGPFGAVIEGDNIVARTLTQLSEADPRLRLGRIKLEKRLPVASGIGGGSADAAAVLRAVRQANPDFANLFDWGAMAASLGADVRVCMESKLSWMTGKGDHVRVLTDPLPALTAVIANPMAQVPRDKTAQVFHRLAAAPLSPGARRTALPDLGNALDSLDALIAHMRAAGNDLTAAASAIMPDIAGVLSALSNQDGCRVARLSGAGPTCFGLFLSSALAEAAAGRLRSKHPHWWIEPISMK